MVFQFSQTKVKGIVSCGSMAPPGGPDSPEQQMKGIREALALCQACCSLACVKPLSEETWALLPLEDLRGGGSIHLLYKKTSRGHT